MSQILGQLSMFDKPEQIEEPSRLQRMYREALGMLHKPLTGNPEKCREDVRRMAEQTDGDPERLAEALKDYFGVCGFSLKDGMFNMDGSSCWIQAWRPWETMIIPWRVLAKEIIRLCVAGLW